MVSPLFPLLLYLKFFTFMFCLPQLVLSALPYFIVVFEAAETEIREEDGFAQNHGSVEARTKF